MPYDEFLADRLEQILTQKKVNALPKKMFGGIAFMVKDKMSVGVVSDRVSKEPTLMVRVGKERYSDALKMTGAREMDFTGKPMAGYVFVSPDGFDLDQDLEKWVDLALAFNAELTKKG